VRQRTPAARTRTFGTAKNLSAPKREAAQSHRREAAQSHRREAAQSHRREAAQSHRRVCSVKI